MEEMKLKFVNAVAAKLSAAPPSTAKAELVEELSDNLYHRFLDMTGAGLDDETAFSRSMEDLGDVDELLGYLAAESQSGPGGTEQASGGAWAQGANSGPQGPQNDLSAFFSTMAEACRTAVDQTREAMIKAKDALQRRTTWEKDNRHVKVHFNTHPEDRTAPPQPADEPPAGQGWEFEAELDADAGRFFAGAGPSQKKGTVYGFGYDKDRGGFFAQWGEYQSGAPADSGPRFTGQRPEDGGSCSVSALKDLRGIEVHTVAGDVSIHVSEAPEAGVIIDGDVDDLNVTCSADGVLTIREGRTASSSFFSRRGIGSADVELFLPRRHWETLCVTTSSGDVVIDRDGLDVDQLSVNTASGDLCVRLRACRQLRFSSASGDLDLSGGCAQLRAETMSGDINLRGQLDSAVLKSASGDIELEGLVHQFRGETMSGDVRVVTSQLPRQMEMASKSGDCEARLPDEGPFTLRFKTVSGEVDFAFPFQYDGRTAVYGDCSGGCPAYVMTTVSGGVTVERY